MPQFQFTANDPKSGQSKRGNIEAATEAESVAKIAKHGLTVTLISVVPVTPIDVTQEKSPPQVEQDSVPPVNERREGTPQSNVTPGMVQPSEEAVNVAQEAAPTANAIQRPPALRQTDPPEKLSSTKELGNRPRIWRASAFAKWVLIGGFSLWALVSYGCNQEPRPLRKMNFYELSVLVEIQNRRVAARQVNVDSSKAKISSWTKELEKHKEELAKLSTVKDQAELERQKPLRQGEKITFTISGVVV